MLPAAVVIEERRVGGGVVSPFPDGVVMVVVMLSPLVPPVPVRVLVWRDYPIVVKNNSKQQP